MSQDDKSFLRISFGFEIGVDERERKRLLISFLWMRINFMFCQFGNLQGNIGIPQSHTVINIS